MHFLGEIYEEFLEEFENLRLLQFRLRHCIKIVRKFLVFFDVNTNFEVHVLRSMFFSFLFSSFGLDNHRYKIGILEKVFKQEFMEFIDNELSSVSKLCKNCVPDSRLVSCVRSMVRVEITRTAFKKIVVCIQFPEDYPKVPLLVQLKSKTLSSAFLDRLEEICEEKCKTILEKEQVLDTLKFIRNFLEENPLCCCYDEITRLRGSLVNEGSLKLNSKKSYLRVTAAQGLYYFKTKVVVPDDYPLSSVCLIDADTNFPPLITRYLLGQSKELARRCVEPPLNKQHANFKSFSPSPSLEVAVSFLIRAVKTLPKEPCQLCKATCLPENPKSAVVDESADLHVERLYCGHLFHLQCLVTYMKTPPFHGGKKCPGCGQRVYHDKWGLSEKLAEDRWAHQQARDRELAEVTDFFQ